MQGVFPFDGEGGKCYHLHVSVKNWRDAMGKITCFVCVALAFGANAATYRPSGMTVIIR
jgi:hypothetical protein